MPDLDEEFQGPDQPSRWVQVEDLGADSLFLGLNHPLMGNLSEDLDLVGKSSWVYISDDRVTLRRRAEADWIGMHISNVRQPMGGFSSTTCRHGEAHRRRCGSCLVWR
jgi:hypothetical protein